MLETTIFGLICVAAGFAFRFAIEKMFPKTAAELDALAAKVRMKENAKPTAFDSRQL